jgi:hypothetical protein
MSKKGCDNMALVCMMNWKERTLTFPCFSLLKNQCGLTSKQKESLKAWENVQLINSSFNGACMKRFKSDLFVPVMLKDYKNSFASEETLAYVASPTTRLFGCAPTLLLQHQW